MPTEHIARLLDPAYLEGVQEISLEELRQRRTDCQEVETALSYVRRMVQGRLDIVMADLQRRAGGQPGDLSTLVDNLTEILSDRVRSPGLGRLPTFLAPAEAPADLTAEVDQVVDADQLGSLPELSDDEVRALADALSEFEQRLSAQRRQLLDRIDAIQQEIVRRYKEGEASVDNLLR